MKQLLILSFVFISACNGQQGVELVYSEKGSMFEQSQTAETRFFIRDDKIRVDMQVGPMNISIYYQAAGERLAMALHNAKIMYIDPDLAAMKTPVKGDSSDYGPTGSHSEVAGVKCANVSNSSKDGRFSGCLAQFNDLDLSSDQAKTFSRFILFINKIMGQRLGKGDGVLIESKLFASDGKQLMKSALKEYYKQEINDSLFETPAGYKMVKH